MPEENKTNALDKRAELASALATVDASDLLRDAGQGTQNLGPDDVRPPRIVLCQSGTPQRKEGNERFIKGLNELDMFNDLSGEVYGRGPLKFVVVAIMKPRFIEFAPIDEGGGVLDMNVPASDPRAQFSTGEDGKRVKPVATMFREYIVWLPEKQEAAILSMKGSNLKIAVQLNSKINLALKGELIDPSLAGKIIADPPAWARTFQVSTIMKNEDNYSWGMYKLELVGLTPTETRLSCSDMAKFYAGKNVIIDVDDTDNPHTAGDATPF